MTSNSPTNSPKTSDEAFSSDDDELSSNRRRRFCIERKQQLLPTASKPKRTRIDSDRARNLDYRPSGKRRREGTTEQRSSFNPTVIKSIPNNPLKEQPKGPVIFINPMFVKKFIAKSLNLASVNSKLNNSIALNATTSLEGANAIAPPAVPLNDMIKDIDFKTSTRESLQAASTMAIIRLVTECIEDDSKRDEKLNKVLVARLIDGLMHHGEVGESDPLQDDVEPEAASSQNISSYNSGISEEDIGEAGPGGRPIPVIGGSVSHHFKKNISSSQFYSKLKPPRHNPYQRPKRSSVSDRHNTKSSETNKSGSPFTFTKYTSLMQRNLNEQLTHCQNHLNILKNCLLCDTALRLRMIRPVPMHLIEPIRSCIDDIIKTTGDGLKSMVLDDFTTGVVGAGYSRSEMLLREVYLFERIDTIFESSERLNHMKCIVILRPTRDNVELLCRELYRPHYRTYHVYFTCRVGSTLVKKLAEADETEVVRCIKELPLDFHAITPFLFSLRFINHTFDLKNNDWLPEGLKRVSDGLASVLIALQINPMIRYQTQSQPCKILAEKLSNMMKNESLANKTWRKVAPYDVNSLLLIVDRRHDLVTPIVNKWTYYAMIHEQFNISSNRISLTDCPNRQPKDPKEMMISLENDLFFDENYHKNYGELGVTLKDALKDLKAHTKSQHKVETIEDMKRFIDEYPETRRYASNLHNHVFLMSELTRIVTEHKLIPLSECEQELACSSTTQSDLLKRIKQLVSSSSVRALDAMRLVSLYTVCRSDKTGLNDLIKLLKSRPDIDLDERSFINQLRDFTLSKPQNPFDETVQQVTRMIVQGVKGVENVLTQYRPCLYKIIEDLRKGNKLKETHFAFQGERYREEPPRKLIIFVIGGVTYDEALLVDEIDRLKSSEIQIVIGGTSIHNFKSFMDEVRHAVSIKASAK